MLIASMYGVESALITNPVEIPFFLDLGASSHITCQSSDFSTIHKLSEPHKISGVGNTSVYTMGVGTVELILHITNAWLQLQNVLYVPKANIHLVSVHQLNQPGYSTTFSLGTCQLVDLDGALLANCSPGLSNLHTLPNAQSRVDLLNAEDITLPSLQTIPNLEIWYRCLGHTNHEMVLGMARSGVVSGMPVNISMAPQTCKHCVMGKQTRSSVLKELKGAQPKRRLECVYIDLSGPHSIMSRLGFKYIMNFVNNYSGYNWTRLLKMKLEVVKAFRDWITMVKTQTGEKLCQVLMDNGELKTTEMAAICNDQGVLHQFTAPYMSAQNGHVEQLHRTLMEKSQAMRLSCDTPVNMWDKFILTSSYLNTITTSCLLNGKTPYKLWFAHETLTPPSL